MLCVNRNLKIAVTRKARRKNMGRKIRTKWTSPVGFAGKLMTQFPVADFGDSGPMICNPQERIAIGRRLAGDSQTRSGLLATKSVAGVIGIQHALRAAPASSLPAIARRFLPFNFDAYQLQVKYRWRCNRND
jgi:hypothetical protein